MASPHVLTPRGHLTLPHVIHIGGSLHGRSEELGERGGRGGEGSLSNENVGFMAYNVLVGGGGADGEVYERTGRN